MNRTLMEQCDEATDLAKRAFAVGDKVTGLAAIVLAGQILQLLRLSEVCANDQPGTAAMDTKADENG